MTHAEKAARRKRIVQMVREGQAISLVARKFDVSRQTVESAVRVAGIIPAREFSRKPHPKAFTILKNIVDGAHQSDIAREFKCSRQYINQIYKAALKAGFTINTKE